MGLWKYGKGLSMFSFSVFIFCFYFISTKLEKFPFWFFLCTRDAMDDPLFLHFFTLNNNFLFAILREIIFLAHVWHLCSVFCTSATICELDELQNFFCARASQLALALYYVNLAFKRNLQIALTQVSYFINYWNSA